MRTRTHSKVSRGIGVNISVVLVIVVYHLFLANTNQRLLRLGIQLVTADQVSSCMYTYIIHIKSVNVLIMNVIVSVIVIVFILPKLSLTVCLFLE